MKILYIIKSFAMKAGVERVMADKMNYLRVKGYEVVLVTYEQGGHPLAFPLEEGIRHYDLDARFFTLSRLPLWRRPLARRAMRHTFRTGLQAILDREQPNILITTTYSMKVLDIVLNVKANAKRIVESHVACHTVSKAYDYRDNPLLRPIASIYDHRAFALIRRFDRLVVLTKGDAQDWQRYIDRVDIIPNPVTLYPAQVLPHDGTGRRIIGVGRLHEQKGFDLLIEAFSQIAADFPGWHIDIFGSGDEKPVLEALIEKRGLAGRVAINQPTAQIYDEYQRSELFVLSSRYEGFGLVLVEAMSCGIPVVAFRCKYGPEDIVEDGHDGLLATDGDTTDLAHKMRQMMTSTEARLCMGREARTAAKRYSKETIMQQWTALFETLKR